LTKRPTGGVTGHGEVLSWRDKHGLTLTAALGGTTLMYAVDIGPPTPHRDDRLALSLDDSAPATVSAVDGGCQQFYRSHTTNQYNTFIGIKKRLRTAG